jgi:hypothetical protein
MQRRDVLKLLGSGIALSALPQEAMAMLAQAGAEATGGLKTLKPHQNETVVLMAEMIIPATDTPGATGAKVNEFMDLLLTEWYDPAETSRFLAGLAQVDEESQKQFGKDFVNATAAQQTALLHQLDTSAMTFAQAQKKAQATGAEPPAPDFFYQFKKLTLAGYYTSQIGFSKELGKTIIPPRHAGCAPCPEDSHVHANG